LTDCDQGLSEKIITLEHRLNALSSQLDSQKDSQKDRQEIDTDSQEIDDMEPLLKLQREASIADHSPLPPSPDEPNAIEPAIEDAIDTLAAGDTSPTDDPAIKPAIKTIPKTHSAIAKELGLKSQSNLNYWVKKGEIPTLYGDRIALSPDGKKIMWIGD
jgi:hypothetical protein